jgi:trehalose-6-phosphatase
MTRVLVASDFDGTILPADAPAGELRWYRAAHALFRVLQLRRDITLAVLSGRDPDELSTATQDIRCCIVASYGRYIRASDGDILRDAAPLDAPDGAWAVAVEHLGGVIERKRHGVAIHWRMSSRLGPQHPAVRTFRTWARANRLRVIEGATFCEAVVRGPAKLAALRVLHQWSGADRVIYAGDGRSDLAAVRWAAQRGYGFYIGRDRTGLRHQGVTVVFSIAELWRVARAVCLRGAGA